MVKTLLSLDTMMDRTKMLWICGRVVKVLEICRVVGIEIPLTIGS